jgi:hypothetical protein
VQSGILRFAKNGFAQDDNPWTRKGPHRLTSHPQGEGLRILSMANLTLVYGMRLLPADDITEVGEAPVKLKNGREAHVTMHVLEGSKEEIEKQLRTSLEAFFDLYPEI